ncbi:MAG: GtrA family protein [Clostridia bacterium]|nr:GtrA family protein [Clostridia bacterium]
MTAIRELFLKIKETFVSKRFIMFCLLGVFNTFNHSWLSTVFSYVMQANLAYAVGNYFSLSIAFFLSSYFVFKRSPSVIRYIRFLMCYIPSFIIGFLMGFITLNILGLHQFWGTALAAITGGPITFVIIKVYTFGRK